MKYIPSTIEKVFESSGYPCAVIHDNMIGFRCGYVGVDEKHPLYGKDYSVFDGFIEVHGGVIFSGHSILVETDTPTWWIGFDCAHAFDKCDIYDKITADIRIYQMGEKRSLGYCIAQCTGLARQLRKMTLRSISDIDQKHAGIK